MKMSSIARTLAVVGLFVFVLLAAYECYLESNFGSYRHCPDPKHSLSYHWKSVTIYISAHELSALRVIHVAEFVSIAFVLGYAIIRIVERRRRG